jgi:hypothetical protein
MAHTPSIMASLGTEAPAFRLPDTVSGKELSLQQLKGDVATVIMFICSPELAEGSLPVCKTCKP